MLYTKRFSSCRVSSKKNHNHRVIYADAGVHSSIDRFADTSPSEGALFKRTSFQKRAEFSCLLHITVLWLRSYLIQQSVSKNMLGIYDIYWATQLCCKVWFRLWLSKCVVPTLRQVITMHWPQWTTEVTEDTLLISTVGICRSYCRCSHCNWGSHCKWL